MKKEAENQADKKKDEIPAAENSAVESACEEKSAARQKAPEQTGDDEQTANEVKCESPDKEGNNKSGGKEQTPPEQKKPNEPEEQEQDLKADIESLQKKFDETKEQLEKQKNLFLRTVAEYDNYRKRTEREKTAVYSDATAAAVKEILPVEDNLSRALEQKNCSAEDLRKGVEMVEKQMRAAFDKLGVTEMGKAGEPFDPAYHSAVSHVEDKDAKENTVTQVFQKGYKLDGKVIRHAMVQVTN